MRKLFSLVLIGIILIIAVISNPKQELHQDFLKKELKNYLEQEMKADAEEENTLGNLVLGLGKLLGGAAIDLAVNETVSADNYLFFSLTKLRHDGKEDIIGIGLFGNVVLFRDVEEVIKKGWLEDYKKE